MKKGFTLIELIVVVAIVAILSTVVIQSLVHARTKGACKAGDSAACADLQLTGDAPTPSYR